MVRTATLPHVTLRELSLELGISRDALKRRLSLMRTLGIDGAPRDARGALILQPESVAILRRALELERQGLSMRDALRRALSDAHGEAPDLRPPAPETRAETCKDAVRAAGHTTTDPYLLPLWVAIAVLGVSALATVSLAFLAVLRR